MKIQELRKKTKKELEGMVKDFQERQRFLRFDLVAGKVKNVREIRQIRKEIARILTIINQKSKLKN